MKYQSLNDKCIIRICCVDFAHSLFKQANMNDLSCLYVRMYRVLIVHHSWINGSLFGAMNENITVLYTNSMLAHILWILR